MGIISITSPGCCERDKWEKYLRVLSNHRNYRHVDYYYFDWNNNTYFAENMCYNVSLS